MASFIRTWLVEGTPARLVRQLVLGMSTRRNVSRRLRPPGFGGLRNPPEGRRVPVRFLGFEAGEEGGLMPAPVAIAQVQGGPAGESLKGQPVLRVSRATGETDTEQAA